MANLPENWCVCSLDDVLSYEQPQPYIVKNANYSDDYKIPVLTAGKSFIIGYTKEETGVYDKLPAIIFDDFTTSSKIVNFKFKVKSSAMKILKPRLSELNLHFFYYLMQTIECNHNTHKRYWISDFSQKEILLPPLAEQERIVQKIEELFAEIDAGIENLKIVNNQIKLYRQSVLKNAFEGKLTLRWREKKYKEDKYVKKIFTPYAIPVQWEWCKLSQLGEIGRGKSKHRPRNDKRLYGGKYPFIQTGEIKAAEQYIQSFSETYNDFGLSQSKLWNEDTLCITIAANIAETAILKIKACFPDSVVGFIKNDLIDKTEYIEYYFRLIRENLDKVAPATAQKNINLQTLNEVLIPLPPLAEQERIVAEIETRFERADAMELAVQNALDTAEKLKQAILKKAFRGELVPQNPNDEPASVLLDRIRAERNTEQKTRKKGKK